MTLVHGSPSRSDTRGVSAELIAWPENRVVKLFRPGFPGKAIEAEFLNASAASSLGVPTPRPERIVEIKGRYGILFERCPGIPLYDELVSDSENVEQLVYSFYKLQRTIHASPPENFPIQAVRMGEKIRRAAVPDSAKSKALQALDQPQGFPGLCHGDFHPLNVLLTPSGAVAIDWQDACQGDTAADVARTLLLLEFARPRTEDAKQRLLFLNAYQHLCMEVMSHAVLQAWRLPVAVARLAEPVEAQERTALLCLVQTLVDSAPKSSQR
jgi:aminoglycoside phosphotransferase (APT) family kinase protein